MLRMRGKPVDALTYDPNHPHDYRPEVRAKIKQFTEAHGEAFWDRVVECESIRRGPADETTSLWRQYLTIKRKVENDPDSNGENYFWRNTLEHISAYVVDYIAWDVADGKPLTQGNFISRYATAAFIAADKYKRETRKILEKYGQKTEPKLTVVTAPCKPVAFLRDSTDFEY